MAPQPELENRDHLRKCLIDLKDSCSAAAQLQETADTGLFTANDPLASLSDSWAAQPATNVAIWTLRMALGAHRTLPAAQVENTRRSLYFFKGATVSISG